jgi:hypothetical protein
VDHGPYFYRVLVFLYRVENDVYANERVAKAKPQLITTLANHGTAPKLCERIEKAIRDSICSGDAVLGDVRPDA